MELVIVKTKIISNTYLRDIEKLRAGDRDAGIPSYADKVHAFFRAGEQEKA